MSLAPPSIEREPLVLTHEFEYALDRFESGDHLFITGRAGTGKSTLLQLIRRTTQRTVAVLAPTGVAALNVRGQTIHSFFGFPGKLLRPRDVRKKKRRGLYTRLDTLIIDEVSMVRADLIDRMDEFLRLNREDDRPFGGVQIVLFGDLFQLPPVVASDVERQLFGGEFGVYPSPHFFDAEVWKRDANLELLELNAVFRQKARQFVRLLDAVREGHFDYDDLQDLNERHIQAEEFVGDPAITLTATNRLADQINQLELQRLSAKPNRYVGTLEGNFDSRNLPADLALQLKPGAQVMFVRNDTDGKRYVNGSLGVVLIATKEQIVVRVVEDGREDDLTLTEETWESIRYTLDETTGRITESVTGIFKQYPIKLAWAITIHKSQGKTFERMKLDLGRGAFESGQTYVALSRCRTLEGIRLAKPLRGQDVIVDPRVADWYNARR